MKLVSILMPTRNPYPWLERALDSIKNTATRFWEVEILLRIDDDDKERIAKIPHLQTTYGAKCLVGPRFNGYVSMGCFIDELVLRATGKWAWLFDDDAWVEGSWQPQLGEMACDADAGPAVNCEQYVLGGSEYSNVGREEMVGLIVPMGLPQSLAHATVVDSHWMSEIRYRHWQTRQLMGVRYCHDGRVR